MKLDRLIQALLLHDERFYQFFEESAANLIQAADLFSGLFEDSVADHQRIVMKMHELEHFGDSVTYKYLRS